jgi:DNA-binding NarL/FixJ family response regulator
MMTEQNLLDSTRRVLNKGMTVCLLSPHPLVLSEFSALLIKFSFHVKTTHFNSPLSYQLRELDLPECPLYVVDAYATTPASVLVAEVADKFPEAHVIALGERFDESNAFPLLRVGAKGLLTYAEARNDLPRAIDALMDGSFWVPRVLLARFVDSILPGTRSRYMVSSPAGLSRREREVLQAVLENLSNKEIAGQLNISERTAKFHVSNLLAKFGVQRRADLILMCFKGPSLGSVDQQQSGLPA